MNDVKFGTVLLGGSKEIGTIPDKAVAWLDHFIEANEHFIIGDCYGADLALQNYLNSRGYENVTVCCFGEKCRFNVGGWEENCGGDNLSEYSDAMINACDCALLLWDGQTQETGNNIDALKERGLPIFIYRTDIDAISVIRRKCKLEKTNKEI